MFCQGRCAMETRSALKMMVPLAEELSKQLIQVEGVSDAATVRLSGTLNCRQCCWTRLRVVPSSIMLRKERSVFISKSSISGGHVALKYPCKAKIARVADHSNSGEFRRPVRNVRTMKYLLVSAVFSGSPLLSALACRSLGYERLQGRHTKKLRIYELRQMLKGSAQDAALEPVSPVYRSSQFKKVLKKGCPERVSEKGCILLL